MSAAGRGTLSTFSTLERLAAVEYIPAGGAAYPPDTFGRHMRQVAQLIKAEIGLEAAVLEIHGWDSHISQVDGLVGPMRGLSRGLEAFSLDLRE